MKHYIKPMMIVEPTAINPWWEYTSDGWIEHIDPTIPAGDVELQSTNETWGDLW